MTYDIRIIWSDYKTTYRLASEDRLKVLAFLKEHDREGARVTLDVSVRVENGEAFNMLNSGKLEPPYV